MENFTPCLVLSNVVGLALLLPQECILFILVEGPVVDQFAGRDCSFPVDSIVEERATFTLFHYLDCDLCLAVLVVELLNLSDASHNYLGSTDRDLSLWSIWIPSVELAYINLVGVHYLPSRFLP